MQGSATSYRYLSSSATDVGCLRQLNEDALLERPEIGLWAVADGMGGHDSGDLASQTVIESLFRTEPPLDSDSFSRDVQWRIRVAHQALRREAARRDNASTIGSTVVALLISGSQFTCVWAGDSRLYLLRNGVMRQVTRDHSLVQEMVDAGQLDAELAETHPRANVITRAVGASEDLDLEKRSESVQPGDRLMLCSDGLSRYVANAEITEILTRTEIADAAPALVRAALAQKTRDNVSVIVVACEQAGDADDDLADTLPRAGRRSAASLTDLEAKPDTPSDDAAPLTSVRQPDDSGDAVLDSILSRPPADRDSAPEDESQRGWSGFLGRFRPPGPRKG